MNEEKSKLGDDLLKKLHDLCMIRQHREFLVTERFLEIRANVDYDTERLLQELGPEEADKIARLTDTRDELLRNLKAVEERVLARRPDDELEHFDEVLDALRRRVEEVVLSALCNDASESELEDVYVQLATEIIRETNELERRIFGSEMVVYLGSREEKDRMGALVDLKADYLRKEAVEFLNSFYSKVLSLENIHLEMDKSLSHSLVVGLSRPFILSVDLIVIDHLRSFFKANEQLDSRLVCFEHPIGAYTIQFGDDLIANRRLMKCFRLRIASDRLRALDPQLLPFAKQFVELDLNGSRLASLNEELMRELTSLKTLRLRRSFRPDVKFSLGFLSSLGELKLLELTLPDAALDLSVFERLEKLRDLTLESASSVDANVEFAKLENEDLAQLNIRNLEVLALSYFEIDCIDWHTFTDFRNLGVLKLTQNRINLIHRRAFHHRPSVYLEFKDNEVTDASLKKTSFDFYFLLDERSRDLDISNTRELSKARLRKSRFKRKEPEPDPDQYWPYEPPRRDKSPPKVATLELFASKRGRSSLEEFKHFCLNGGSFQTLDGIELSKKLPWLNHLDLSESQLTTIKPSWLEGLPHLTDFKAAGNLIETLDEPALFRSVAKLETIDLSRNRLKNFDRRLFRNLFELKTLDLSENKALFVIDYGSFRGLMNLTELALSGNSIERLDLAKIFESCRRLEKLKLSNNNLGHDSVNEDAMNRCLDLKVLQIASNRLVNMEFVRNLSKLEELDLSANMIESVEKDGFNLLGRLVSLLRLNLSRNRIKSIGPDHLVHLGMRLLELDVTENPLETPFPGGGNDDDK